MNTHPYDRLTPDLVIDAVESVGYLSDVRLLQCGNQGIEIAQAKRGVAIAPAVGWAAFGALERRADHGGAPV